MSIQSNMEPPSQPPEHSPDNQRPGEVPSSPASGGPGRGRAGGSAEGADRLTVLVHELGNLLDGSLRSLSLAKRSLGEPEQHADGSGDDGRRCLDVVQSSLLRMAEIVDAAMRQPGRNGGGFAIPSAPIELGEAIFHAVDVISPIAAEHNIRITTLVSNGLSGVPAGSLYSAILNGLTNAVEAVIAAQKAPGDGGTVEVSAVWTEDGRLQVSILDDGCGLPDAPTETLERFGFTTKVNGPGVGLAVARGIVNELPEGTLRLMVRPEREGQERPGALYEITYRPCASSDGTAGAA